MPEFPGEGASPKGTAPELGDLSPEDLRAELHRIADWAATYRETIGNRAIAPRVSPGAITARLPASVPSAPETISRIRRDLDEVLMPGILHWGHPAFLGYFGSTSNGPALVAEVAAAALNVSAMTWKTSPAATELETVVLSWIRQLLGLPDGWTGVVYDTASIALLHALAAARELAALSVRRRGIAGRADVPVFRVYASEQAHSSVEKTAIVLGLGEENVVRLPTDDSFALDPRALADAVRADVAAGRKPLAAVATVGTTSTASVDPVPAIAEICRTNGLWLHVDAAYGGAIGVLPERRSLLSGIELADSVVVNPHKWLFVPLDFSALYVRRPEALRAVFALTPEYLSADAAETTGAEIDYMDYGLQLGRRFRALKAWVVIRAFGRDGIAARIREHCRLARVFAAAVEADPEFTLAAPVVMAVVCFRWEPPGSSEAARDRWNAAIVSRVNAAGEAYLTQTRLRGRVVMRVGIGNIRTTEADVVRAWASICRAARDTGGPEPDRP